MKILMLGPPKGHNIKLYLDYFENESRNDRVLYMYSGKKKYSFDGYSKIEFLNYIKNFIKCVYILSFRINSFDLIWIHNWTRPHIILFLLIFRRKKTKINFSVWSEPIPRKALTQSIQGKIYKFIFSKSTFVQCLWIGTFDIVKQISDQINVILFPWGLPEEYFQESENLEYKNETLKFISTISKSKTNFFWPKSISLASRHDLVIQASYLLKMQGITNFKVYLWLGNAVKSSLLKNLISQISLLNVDDVVEFVDHNFLPFEDIILIWKNMDVGLQIATHDSLSTSLLEPMLFKKEIIASDILPYRHLEREFDLDLKLIPLEVTSLKKSMLDFINGIKTVPNELDKRCDVIKENFHFSRNTDKILIHIKNFELK